MIYHILPTLIALWIITDAKYIDPLCVVKVSDSVHDAVFGYNHELILRLWYWASANQTANFTISIPSLDPTVKDTHNKKIYPAQSDTGWIEFEVLWPRPASNLSIVITGGGEEVNEAGSSSQESKADLGLHITSDHLLVWLNTDPHHLNDNEQCQEAAQIVNYLTGSDKSIPSYMNDVVGVVHPDGNPREFDRRTAVIVILSIFLVGALLSLVAICCYIRQSSTPQSMGQYEEVKLWGSGPSRDGTLSNVTEATEEIPKQH